MHGPSQTLREQVRQRKPTVGAAVGSGMTARAAAAGGADFLMVLNAGYFRLLGCSSMAALLPYAGANRLVWEIAEHQVLPRTPEVPAFAGLCAQDPGLCLAPALERIRRAGLCGVTNFPSVGFIDGQYREALEEAGLGYEREVALIRSARDHGLMSVAFVFHPAEAVEMARAGADILLIDLGFAEWRERSGDEHQRALDEAIRHLNRVVRAVEDDGHGSYFSVLGGPVGTPRDSAQVYEHTPLHGYVGGSAIERFPAAPLIAQTVREFKAAADRGGGRKRLGGLIGHSEPMKRVFRMIEGVADTDAPVLLLGESGTGKELAARELHRLSARRNGPLVCWNCGAMTETLAMSELFGHERGAFTGATHQHRGRFEQAQDGTLFMDEVSELPPTVQASLLRVLQEREIIRVGGSRNIPVNVRLVAASNRDVREMIRSGRFRLDLLYRINTVVIRIPPLRERREDIPFLVAEMAQEFSRLYEYPVPEIPRNVMDVFMRHTWPGNVRELRNAVERCIILGRGERFRAEWFDDLMELAGASREATGPARALADRQALRAGVHEALARNNGNKSATARELGVSRRTLYAWLRDPESPTGLRLAREGGDAE